MTRMLFLIALISVMIAVSACSSAPQQITGEAIAETKAEIVPTGVMFVALPEIVKEGDRTIISWQVQGQDTLNASETALYFDAVSHPGTLTDTAAPDEAGYAHHTAEYMDGPYPVPGVYSTILEIPEGAVAFYMRAYARIAGSNVWSEERYVSVDVPSVHLTDVPSTVPPAGLFSAGWYVNSMRRMVASKNAVYYDIVPHSGFLSRSVGPRESGYKYVANGMGSQEYAIPRAFSTDIMVPEGAEEIFLRAYSSIADKHYWSPETTIAVGGSENALNATEAPSAEGLAQNVTGASGAIGNASAGAQEISTPAPVIQREPQTYVEFLAVPSTVKPDEMMSIRWRIESEIASASTSTAVYYDVRKQLGQFGTSVTPQSSGYLYLTKEYLSGVFAVPGSYSTSFDVPRDASEVYVRAHAYVAGRNYWTREIRIMVEKTAPLIEEPVDAEFIIEADDAGLYPASIEVSSGKSVRLRFLVRNGTVSDGGFDFRSKLWNTTGVIAPGQNKSVTFDAQFSFEFGAYVQSTNRLMKTGIVIVD